MLPLTRFCLEKYQACSSLLALFRVSDQVLNDYTTNLRYLADFLTPLHILYLSL